jgi:hypothetical protein
MRLHFSSAEKNPVATFKVADGSNVHKYIARSPGKNPVACIITNPVAWNKARDDTEIHNTRVWQKNLVACVKVADNGRVRSRWPGRKSRSPASYKFGRLEQGTGRHHDI